MEVSGELHALGVLPPWEEPPVGGCVGPRVGLDAVEKRNNPFNALVWYRTPISQSVAYSLY
jgi:hypothetical protein